jgi:Zn-dependent peptidase ImmA (M78 family)
LSFNYQQRSATELEQIAGIILSRFANRRSGHFIDIEAIIEDCAITPIPRRGGLHYLVNGYAAKDPRYIVISESYASYPERYRSILAEEFCHIVLEYDLLKTGTLPKDAEPHNLTFEQHQIIERDAQYLARAVLIPADSMVSQWNTHFDNAPEEARQAEDCRLIHCAESLESVFVVWPLTIAYRARDLKLITDGQCRSYRDLTVESRIISSSLVQ